MKVVLDDYGRLRENPLEEDAHVVTVYNKEGFSLSIRLNKDGSFNINGSDSYVIKTRASNSIEISIDK